MTETRNTIIGAGLLAFVAAWLTPVLAIAQPDAPPPAAIPTAADTTAAPSLPPAATPTAAETNAAPAPAAPETPVQTPPATTPPGAPSDETTTDLQDRVADLESRLDEVEKAQEFQRLRWSAEFRTILSSFWYHGPSPDGLRGPAGNPLIVDERNEEQWLARVRLNLSAEPTSNLRFTGRLTMFKRFGTNTTTPFPQDSSQTRVPGDSGVRFERAWLDWFITPWMALSAGRISYTGGPPTELKDNRPAADATWGQQMVDGEYDSVDLTLTGGDLILARAFYASWVFPRQDDLFSSYLFLNNGTENLRIVGGNLDLRLVEGGRGYIQLGAYYVPEFRPFAIPITSPNPPPNPTNAPPPFDGSLLFPSSLPSSMGAYSNYSALMMWKDIGSSGLDLFASGAIGLLRPNDEAISYPLGPNGESVPLLVLASGGASTHTTYFAFAGGRMTLPFGGEIAPKIGVEYNYGSRYLISFATPTSDLTNKLGNRGHAYEAYIIQPVNQRLFLRASYLFVDTQYSGGFFGASPAMSPGGTSPAVDQTLRALSLTLDAVL